TAAGRRSVLCGNIGRPVLDMLEEPAELLAVELSSFQLHWAPSLRPEAVAARLLTEATAPMRVGFRLGEPAKGELGVRDGMLVDAAFADGLFLAPASAISVPGPVGVLDALAAAALARAVEVPAEAI